MKQKTIRTAKATVLVVEMPEGITEVTNTGKRLSIPDRKGGHRFFEGNWQLLGRLPDIAEEQYSKIVNPESDFQYEYKPSKEMFNLLLQANEVYFDNPLGERPVQSRERIKLFGTFYYINRNAIELDKWQEAQSKVWDKERTYVFIKGDSFYCKEWNNVGYICEEQCYSCRKTNDFKL